MYNLSYKTHFDAAHKLEDYQGKCANIHGHRWDILFEISTPILNNGMVVDFTELKGLVDKLDHQCLNDILDFNPTAELIAQYLHDKVKSCFFSSERSADISVTVWESPNSSIAYKSKAINQDET